MALWMSIEAIMKFVVSITRKKFDLHAWRYVFVR